MPMEKSGGPGLRCFAMFSCRLLLLHCWNGRTCKPFLLPSPPTDFQVSTPCYKNQCLIGLIHPWKGRSPGEGTCCMERQVFCLLCQAREDKPIFVLTAGGGHAKGAASKTCPWCAPDLNKESQPLDLKCWGKGNKCAVPWWVCGIR